MRWRFSHKLFISTSLSLLMASAQCYEHLMIPIFTLYGWWEWKFRYRPVNVAFRYTDDLNHCSERVISISRKENLLICFFSIVNWINDRIEFTLSSSILTSSWWSQSMKVSSTYLNHNYGFSDIDDNAFSSKYSMYMFTSTDVNGEPIASFSSYRYISDPIPK